MQIPVEILLEIAKHIRNMYDREKYVDVMGIDNLYYESKKRPISKDFMPRKYDIDETGAFPAVNIRKCKGAHVKLPIAGTEKSYYIDVLEMNGQEFDTRTLCRLHIVKIEFSDWGLLWDEVIDRKNNIIVNNYAQNYYEQYVYYSEMYN